MTTLAFPTLDGWAPDWGGQSGTVANVRTTALTDGFETRVSVGFKATLRTRSMSWSNRQTSDIVLIAGWLQARAGLEAFRYTPRNEAAGVWVCPSWTVVDSQYAVQSLSAEFREVQL